MIVTVIGAGTMGHGIAQVFAIKGDQVSLVDLSKEQLDLGVKKISESLNRLKDKGENIGYVEKIISNISLHTDLKQATKDAQLVIEAATENKETKANLFKELDELANPEAILATNTSSISITEIAQNTQRQSQVIGMHFMNPVPLMKLVEIIRGYNTSDETVATIQKICLDIDKTAMLANDYPGFISNRILMPMINEAIHSLYEGVAGVEEIDTIMKLGMAHPMGPLCLADFIGLDVCLSILNVLYDGFKNPKYAPCPLLVNMVHAGKLGVKSKEGFYTYGKSYKEKKVSGRFL